MQYVPCSAAVRLHFSNPHHLQSSEFERVLDLVLYSHYQHLKLTMTIKHSMQHFSVVKREIRFQVHARGTA